MGVKNESKIILTDMFGLTDETNCPIKTCTLKQAGCLDAYQGKVDFDLEVTGKELALSMLNKDG